MTQKKVLSMLKEQTIDVPFFFSPFRSKYNSTARGQRFNKDSD